MKVFNLLACLLALVLLSSCASRQTGNILEDHAVTNQFRSGTVLEKYNYFYYGIELEPDVLLAIDKKYTVESKFWTPVKMTDERLQNWIVTLDRVPPDKGWSRRYGTRYQGAWVLDPQGGKVGMWYSRKDWGVFEYPGDNVIIPYVPSNRTGLGSYAGETEGGDAPDPPLRIAGPVPDTATRPIFSR